MKLLALAPEDIRPLKEGEAGDSEGRWKLSWIWKVVGVARPSEDEGVQEGTYQQSIKVIINNCCTALCVEWC